MLNKPTTCLADLASVVHILWPELSNDDKFALLRVNKEVRKVAAGLVNAVVSNHSSWHEAIATSKTVFECSHVKTLQLRLCSSDDLLMLFSGKPALKNLQALRIARTRWVGTFQPATCSFA